MTSENQPNDTKGWGDPNCIFCKIIAGQIPSYKIYEDDLTFAFLDINPLSVGHILLIPKPHHPTIDTLPDHIAAACGQLLPKLSRAIQKATNTAGWNILQNNYPVSGQEVPHVHFHIIPRQENDNLGYRWNPKSLNPDTAAQLIANITAVL